MRGTTTARGTGAGATARAQTRAQARARRRLRASVSAGLAAVLATTAVLLGTTSAQATGPAPVTRVVPAAGCLDLTPGMNGVKVKLVQRTLGLPVSTWETMDATTVSRVRAFQSTRALRRDGVVDRATWQALGIAQDFCLDRYQMTPRLSLTASPAQRVETFVDAASSFLGAEYVWGGAGPAGLGVDCSGLVLQALYAAGVDPQPISVDRHVQATYRTSVQLFDHPGFSHHPLSQRRRGDLVFYRKTSTGVINHVAIYLGDGRLLEAKEADVHVAPLQRTLPTQTLVQEVVRPFGTAPTQADVRYVDRLYRDFLGRPVDAAGSRTWSTQVASGDLGRDALALRLARSDEYLQATVATAYRTVLRREPDAAGLQSWTLRLREGMSVAEMYSRFHASEEHFRRAGGTAADPGPWVDRMYLELVGRPADAAGRAHWVQVVRTSGRLTVARGFWSSEEMVRRRVDGAYVRLLGRHADAAGLRTWPAVVRRDGDLVLAASLAGSQEYYDRAQAR